MEKLGINVEQLTSLMDADSVNNLKAAVQHLKDEQLALSEQPERLVSLVVGEGRTLVQIADHLDPDFNSSVVSQPDDISALTPEDVVLNVGNFSDQPLPFNALKGRFVHLLTDTFI